MAELEKLLPNHPSGLEQILQEAKHRWLRPAEVCEILRNYQTFQLKPEPPVMPPAGSLFLFDRKALRYFRKDGYRWRKKKDGKTVKEAHEKLKTGSVDSLHCYYAHGEENESFQRRSYWMLDEKLEHIVLVHYREIKEGYKSGISRLLPGRVDCNVQLVSSEHEDVDLGDKPGTSSLMQPPFASSLPQTLLDSTSLGYLFSNGVPALSGNSFGSLYPGSQFPNAAGSSSVWDGGHNSIRCENSMQGQGQKFYEQTTGADFITCKLLGVDDTVHDLGTYGDRLISNTDFQVPGRVSKGEAQGPQDIDSNLGSHPSQKIPNPQMVVTFADQVQKSDEDVSLPNQSTELKKLDSFGRWMDVTIGVDCSDSLMASDSGNYWNTLDGGNDDKEVSSLSHHIQLDVESLGPSLSLEQLFSIIDFSPDWAYSGVGTKVLIVGRFLGGKQHCAETKWGCMFGEVEVPAEVVVDNVLRCITTLHAPGRVPFYVTCSNRLACSEVREFEYREIPRKTATNSSPEAELRLQIRLGKLLNLGSERNSFNCSVIDCDKCKLQKTIYSMKVDSDLRMPRDLLIRNLLSDRLCEWLVSKIHEIGKGPHVLDDEGQGVIHLAASLGYHWAMGPIVAAGVSPNFRDARGMTGLHWASCFGREETVVELVRLGASPGAVDDPTPAFPGGKTAADLASSSGHKGIAGYLAEADLIRQLHQLNIDDNAIEVSAAATIAAENATNVEAEEGVATDDQSMKGSLAAVRKSALAASLVQNAFRNRSFRHRQSTTGGDIIPDDSLRLASLDALHKGQKFGHFEDSLHSAAKNIQKRYRGWRGRNDFLDLRSRVVKIQAHVRGHQARKQYKKVVWSVGIVEKVILRWRRKGVGLRGFRAENSIVEGAFTDIKRSDEYEFLRIGRKQKSEAVEKAFARVKSMVRHPEAREQYMRLVSNFEKLEMGGDGTSASHGVDSSGKSVTERDSTEFPNDQ